MLQTEEANVQNRTMKGLMRMSCNGVTCLVALAFYDTLGVERGGDICIPLPSNNKTCILKPPPRPPVRSIEFILYKTMTPLRVF